MLESGDWRAQQYINTKSSIWNTLMMEKIRFNKFIEFYDKQNFDIFFVKNAYFRSTMHTCLYKSV